MNRSTLRIVVIVLTLITALIHLGLALRDAASGNFNGLTVPFILNGLGYLALLAALFLDVPYFKDHRDQAHYLLMAFAAITLIAFFVVNRADLAGAFGIAAIIAKLDEVLLIIATYMHLQATKGA